MSYAFVDSKCPLSDIETGKVEMTRDERKQVSDWIYK